MEVTGKKIQQTKLGEIPGDWKIEKLSSVCKKVTDGTHDTPKPIASGYALVTSKNLKGGKLNFENCYFISEEDFNSINKRSQVDQYDLLYGMIGTIGNPVIVYQENVDFAVKNVAVFKTGGDKMLAEYLLQYFNSEVVNKYIDRFKDGGVQRFVSLGFLRKFPIILPPLPEQRKIAEILSTVDEQIATTQAIIEETEELKRGLMQELFTRGIGHTRFKETKIGRVPEEWEVKRLDEISEFITKGATPTTYGYEWVEEGIPFLRSECVGENGFTTSGMMFISDDAHNAMSRSQIERGDVLMTITGNVGRVARYPFENGNINQHIARIRITPGKKVLPAFILFQLAQSKYRKYYNRIITGAAYPQISLKQVRETEVFIPPLKEQKQFVELLSEFDTKLEQERQNKANLEKLKRGLLQVLLTGKIRVKV